MARFFSGRLTPLQTVGVVIILTSSIFALVKCGGRGEPWRIIYGKNAAGFVTLAISNESLKVAGVLVTTDVPAPSDFTGDLRIDQPRGLPVGKLIFSDTTTLPGRVTLQLEDHTVDIMERALILDGKEIDWGRAASTELILGRSRSP